MTRPLSENELFALWRLWASGRGQFDVCLHKESGRFTARGAAAGALQIAAPDETDEEHQLRVAAFVHEAGLELSDGSPAIDPEQLFGQQMMPSM